MTFAEVIGGTVRAPSTSALWTNDSDHSPYLLQVTYTANRAEEPLWHEAQFTASASATSTATVDCTRAGGSIEDPGTATYACEVATDEMGFATYVIAMTTSYVDSDDDTITCTAPDTFDVTVTDPDFVDHDRDGVLAAGNEDCDDDDASFHPGADDGTCDGEDQNCDDVLDEGSADDNDAVAPNETAATATETGVEISSTTPNFTVEGNLHNAEDQDWYQFALDPAKDAMDGSTNARFFVVLSVPDDGSGLDGEWDIVVEASSETHGATEPTLTSRAGSPECTDSGCLYRWTVEGASDWALETDWRLGVISTTFGESMCGDDGAPRYSLRVQAGS